MSTLHRRWLSIAGVLLCATIMAPQPGQATVIYDLAADWSNINNPDDAWTLGHYTGGLDPTTFTAFTNNDTEGTTPSGGVLSIWRNGATDPNIIKNLGTTVTTTNVGNITFNADKVTFGPFGGPTVASWTAQLSGVFQVDASFATVQVANAAPSAYIYLDGALVANLGTVPDINILTIHYSNFLTVTAGQRLDFVVWGNNTNNKTTEVSALIQAVPEPATLGLLGAGLIGLAWRRRTLG